MLKIINKKEKKYVLFILFLFSIYCSLLVGETWDESFHLNQGKVTLDYLFSLGLVNKELPYRHLYSPMYWSLQYILSQVTPEQYQIESVHLLNLSISFCTIIGIGKLTKILFNDSIGKITFLILFFYPIFFGHMLFNPKDTILAFCHVWIFFYIFKYLKKQHCREKVKNYLLYIAILSALSSGIQLLFLGSLLPIFIFLIIEIFFLKKIVSSKFNKKILLFDLLKCFSIFYILLIIFWIDIHPNLLVLPYQFFLELFSSGYATGWPINLINGNYYLTDRVPSSYILLNILYKTPEYILLLYIVFVLSLISSNSFYKKNFVYFNYKILLIFLILVFPNLLLFILPYPIYDGMRLFLWVIPYFCIIPAITIYFLIKNLNLIKLKITLAFISIAFFCFLYNFFTITPYQYTYLNVLNGKPEERYKKFESDYWGASIKELINKTDFKKDKSLKIATCGVKVDTILFYLKRKSYFNISVVEPKLADYIIMANRTTLGELKDNGTHELTSCFSKYTGPDLISVQRNKMTLSTIRKIQ